MTNNVDATVRALTDTLAFCKANRPLGEYVSTDGCTIYAHPSREEGESRAQGFHREPSPEALAAWTARVAALETELEAATAVQSTAWAAKEAARPCGCPGHGQPGHRDYETRMGCMTPCGCKTGGTKCRYHH
jgi:hypothetical protein